MFYVLEQARKLSCGGLALGGICGMCVCVWEYERMKR